MNLKKRDKGMRLFETGRIGKLEIKNRILMAPMGIGALAEPDGRLSERAIDYYRARAQGGVGMIITGMTCVDVEVEKKAEEGLGVFTRVDSPIHIGRLAELVEAVHDYGAKLCVQLTAGVGRVGFGDILYKGHAVAPSPGSCFWNPRIKARALTTGEVERLVRAFARAALFLRAAGVDGVELHGHEGYLLDQFQSALWNQRSDKYGGDLEGRLRFPLEVIHAIKATLGHGFPVIYRFGLVHHIKGGREMEESLEMARRFESGGADALEVDAGCYETWYWAHPPTYQPPGCMVDMAEKVKEVVNIPVIAVGKLGYPELAERVLKEKKADFISLGRALLADPEWPEKVKDKRFQEIRPCIGDHTGCLSRIFRGKYLSCTVNPEAGMERAFALRPATKRKSVLIIGGGPAGMQGAVVAARRGHRVSLWEKRDRLGGNLIPASVPAFKKDLRTLVDYLSTQVRTWGVEVRLGKEATRDGVEEADPDVVVVAAGAVPLVPQIPGREKLRLCTAVDLYLGHGEAGEEVVVIGGGAVGCEGAVYLARMGKRVSIVEIMGRICRGENGANRQHLMKMLAGEGVTVFTRSRVEEITERGVVLKGQGGDGEIRADSVVVAAGLKPESMLIEQLKGLPFDVYAVGDCVRPGRVMQAIWEGFRTARLI